MMYYILYPGNDESDTVMDINQLGEDNGFGVFWSAKGFELLMKAVEQNHFLLHTFAVIDDQGKKYSIEEFLDKIKPLKVRVQE